MREGEIRHLDSAGEFFRIFLDTSRTMIGIRRIDKEDRLPPALMEKVMLAVTGVNKCKYCSYRHTRTALEEGVDPEEIANLLEGEIGGLSEDEAIAVTYAQHWADTSGNVSPKARDRVVDYYGEQKTRYMEAHIRAVSFGNMASNTVYAYENGLLKPPEKRRLFFTYLLCYPVAMGIRKGGEDDRE